MSSKILLATVFLLATLKLVPAQQSTQSWLLHHYASTGNWAMIAQMLDNDGANINSLDDEGNTPLMTAVEERQINVVRNLVTRGANVNHRNGLGMTAFWLASYKNYISSHADIARILLNAGADVNATPLPQRNSANQSWALVTGSTPLMLWTRMRGNADMVDLLLRNSADIHRQNGTGDTALSFAGRVGDAETVDLLLKAGSNVDHQNHDGNTALIGVASNYYFNKRSGDPTNIARLLLDAGANPFLPNDKGETLASIALSKDYEGILEVLWDFGYGNLDFIGYHAGTGNLSEAKRLLDAGAEVDFIGYWERTPLIKAIISNHTDVIRELVSRGANVNHRDRDNNTPLIFAAIYDADETNIQFLLDNGADVSLQSRNGRTAFDIAKREKRSQKVLDMLSPTQ